MTATQSKNQNKDTVTPPKQSQIAILRILKPVPWLLLAGFILSFFWDFDGISAQLFGIPLQFHGLLKIICISGLIGFLTNWIAITMLFRPLKKRPLLGQGLIPAHKERIAFRLSSAVSEDLINAEIIKEKISQSDAISKYRKKTIRQLLFVTRKPAFRNDLKEWVLNYIKTSFNNPEFKSNLAEQITYEIESSLNDKLIEKTALKTYSLLKGRSLNNIILDSLDALPESIGRNIDFVDIFLDELPAKVHEHSENLDELLATLIYRLVNRLDVQHLVEENLKNYDEQKLENMIRNATNEQLRTIQYLGAVLGTIGGFVIWEPILSLSFLAVTFTLIYLLDRQLYN